MTAGLAFVRRDKDGPWPDPTGLFLSTVSLIDNSKR